MKSFEAFSVEIGQGLRICNQVLKPTVGLLEAQLYSLGFCFFTQKAVFIVICFSFVQIWYTLGRNVGFCTKCYQYQEYSGSETSSRGHWGTPRKLLILRWLIHVEASRFEVAFTARKLLHWIIGHKIMNFEMRSLHLHRFLDVSVRKRRPWDRFTWRHFVVP